VRYRDTTGDLTLQDLTIRNGQARSGSPGVRGPDRVLCRGGAVSRNNHNGIHVFSDAFSLVPATVTGNVARGNQMDLADDAPHCAGGIWQGNSFQTASRGRIH